MKFVERKIANGGLLVGHMVSDTGGRFEVRHEPKEGYTMQYKGSVLHGKTLDELQETYKRVSDWKREWIDIIEVDIDAAMYQSCPPVMKIGMSWQPKHIAKLPDGSWVSANWNPEASYKTERKEPEYPNEINFPQNITHAYCGSKSQKTIIMRYSEALIAELKQFQLYMVENTQNFTDKLLAMKFLGTIISGVD